MFALALPLALLQQGDEVMTITLVSILLSCCCVVILVVPMLAGLWKIFDKAGKPGWAAIVPFYNIYLLVEIVGRDILWFVLCLILPFLVIVIYIDLAKSFGKGTGYGLGLAFLPFVFFPMLGFGDAQYIGPSAAQAAPLV